MSNECTANGNGLPIIVTKDEDASEHGVDPEQNQRDENNLVNEATDLLTQGIHLLSIKNYPLAAKVLLTACCQFCKVYGHSADECSDPFYYYGCALLECTKSMNRVSSLCKKDGSNENCEPNGCSKVETDGEGTCVDVQNSNENCEPNGCSKVETDAEGICVDVQNSNENCEPNGCSKVETNAEGLCVDVQNSNNEINHSLDTEVNNSVSSVCEIEDSNENCEPNGCSKVEICVERNCVEVQRSNNETNHGLDAENESSKEEETTVAADDISDGQLALEMLKLAEVIYIRQNNLMKLIDVYSKLSDANLLLEDYNNAVKNGEKCLALQEKNPNSSDKSIAQTFIQLGNVFSSSKRYNIALKHFTTAGVILQKCKRHLYRLTESPDTEDYETSKQLYDEIKEIECRLNNIKDEICNVEDLIRNNWKSGGDNNTKTANVLESSTNGVHSMSLDGHKKETIIFHLLQRKRKLVVNDGNSMKKPRLEKE